MTTVNCSAEKEIENQAVVSVRITRRLHDLLAEYMKRDAYITESDFLRDAIREKIKRDAPHLYKRLFMDEGEEKDDR
jgi:Arc/MetJ-type ribon-helix-helix transcriptional regulator